MYVLTTYSSVTIRKWVTYVCGKNLTDKLDIIYTYAQIVRINVI
jgi:hypothetical protein